MPKVVINKMFLIKIIHSDKIVANMSVLWVSYDRRIFNKNHYADAVALQPFIRKGPQAICRIGIPEIGQGRHYLYKQSPWG